MCARVPESARTPRQEPQRTTATGDVVTRGSIRFSGPCGFKTLSGPTVESVTVMQERSQARGTADCISSCLVLSRLVSSRLFSRRCRRLHPEAPPLDACAFPEIPLVEKNRNAMPDGDPNSRHIAPGSRVPDRDSIIQFQPASQPNIAPSSPTFYSYLT